MSKDKLTKEEIKGPDMFVSYSDKVFSVMEEHARSIAAVLALVAVVALGGVAYSHYADSREMKAAGDLFQPETELRESESKHRESQAAKMQALAIGKDKKPPAPEPADYEKTYAPAVAKLSAAIKSHADTKAALISAMNLANFLLQQKQYAAALETVQVPRYKPSDNDLLAGFWRMHRGLVFLENQKADEAIKEYKEIIDAKSLQSFHAEAWLKTGVAQELKGDANKARDAYEKVAKEFANSEAANTAKQYLRLLELKPAQRG